MKKINKKILLIAVALLLSLSLMGTATYAWYSMNREVSTNELTVETTAPSNMLIKSDYNAVWGNASTVVTDVTGGFNPVSTIDAVNFYGIAKDTYLGSAAAGGIVTSSSNTQTTFIKVAKEAETGIYYAEFVLYIKASESTNANENYKLYLRDFKVTSSNADIVKTIRCSVSTVNPIGSATSTGEVTVNSTGTIQDQSSNLFAEGTAKIFKYDTATTVEPIKEISSSASTLNQAILGEDTAIAAGNSADTCFEVDYTGATYTTILVRIWIEGQHPDCLNKILSEKVNITLGWAASN